MPQCPGVKRDGGRCTVIVKPPLTHCYQHDPLRAKERRRNASRAGQLRLGGRAVRDLKRRISAVVESVLDGTVDRGRAAVAIQGLNALRGALELERRVREADDLEERLAEIERRLVRTAEEQDAGDRSWGV